MFRIAICDNERGFVKKTEKMMGQYLRNKGILYEISSFDSEEAFMQLGTEIMKYRVVF